MAWLHGIDAMLIGDGGVMQVGRWDMDEVKGYGFEVLVSMLWGSGCGQVHSSRVDIFLIFGEHCRR